MSHGAVSRLHHINILDLLGVGMKRAYAKRCPIFDVLAAANTY